MKNAFSLALIAGILLSTSSFAQTDCPNLFDSNSNGAVDIEDFLAVLSLFSDVDSDSDGIWDSQDDCIDLEACNYANDPSEPCAYLDVLGVCGGGCEGDGDGDGICDDEDDCVGVLDECGVCNGPGPTEVVIEEITILFDSVYLPQLDEWYVYEFGADTTFSYECLPLHDCGEPLGYQGYDYATVLIGEQCWFAENLRCENYENGDAIPSGLSDSEWQSTSSGAVAVYGEGSSTCSSYNTDGDACIAPWSLNEFGRLYNEHAVNDSRGLCPSGWHVSSDDDWMTLEMALGMSEEEAVSLFWRGTDQGAQMKSDHGWYNGGNGTNSSGFEALSAGRRTVEGDFGGAGFSGRWWVTSLDISTGWQRQLDFSNDQVWRYGNIHPNYGFSVRCVQDAD